MTAVQKPMTEDEANRWKAEVERRFDEIERAFQGDFKEAARHLIVKLMKAEKEGAK